MSKIAILTDSSCDIPQELVLWAVRWYCKYGISYRELQEMLAERGVNVDHSTIYRHYL